MKFGDKNVPQWAFLALLLLFLTMGMSPASSGDDPVYLDANAPVTDRVQDLMKRMTLEEKIAQMCQYVGLEHMKKAEKDMTPEQMRKSDAQGFYVDLYSDDVAQMTREGKIGSFLHVVTAEEANYLQGLAKESRLKIPLLIGIDAIHGNGLVSGSTIYPSPIAQAASWNDELVKESSRQTALEMRATGSHWAFTPNIDVLRDPRWGRSGETFGEDPFLVGSMGVATIKGLQGEAAEGEDHVIACAKHLVAGSQSVNGLNSAPTDISERTLYEIFLPPYRRAIDAGLFSIMAAHNEVNGVPCHMDAAMMTDLLRDKWGFKGFYVSDWNDVSRIATLHHAAETFNEASRLSVEAGLDMHMHGPEFADHIAEAVKVGTLPLSRVNQACAAILETKFRLGLFENAAVDDKAAGRTMFHADHQETALQGAREAITLLSNKQALPLRSRQTKNLLVLGPNANNMTTLGDWVSPQPEDQLITVFEGVKSLGESKGFTVNYFEVADRSKKITEEQIKGAAAGAKAVDVAVLVVGENSFRHDWKHKTTGENIDRATLQLSGKQLCLAKAIHATGTPLVVVYVSGSAISEPWLEQNAAATIAAWEPGSFGGQAIAEVLFGDYNPSGKLPVTMPRSVGQLQMVYNHKPSTYKHKYHTEKKTPLYPFGYGLSYTKYTYSTPSLTSSDWDGRGGMTVTVDLTNAGKMAGTEIAQLYIRDEVSSVTRPVKELKGYQRVQLEPGETKTVTFSLTTESLAFYDLKMNYVVEPGAFKIMVGSSSRDKDLKTTILTVNQKISLEAK